MDKRFYSMRIPFEVGDIIVGDKSSTRYVILDILHTYSAMEDTVVSIMLKVRNLDSSMEEVIDYNNDEWKLIR